MGNFLFKTRQNPHYLAKEKIGAGKMLCLLSSQWQSVA